MNPIPVFTGLIDWAKARRVVLLAVPCILGWLTFASLWENRNILSIVLQVLGALRAPGGGVARNVDHWFQTSGIEPIMASWLPGIVGSLFLLGGGRGAPLGGGRARGAGLAWCLIVPTMVVRGSVGGAEAVLCWWVGTGIIFVVGCLVFEPRMSPDSDRDVPTWLDALQELSFGAIQAIGVLFLPVIIAAGIILDSVAPIVRLDRPMATGAKSLKANR